MKASVFLFLLTGVPLFALAGEPAKPETSAPSPTLSASTNSNTTAAGNIAAADKASAEQLGQQVTRSGKITVKPQRTTGQTIVQSFNPFAPVEPAPTSRWVNRAPWTTVAETASQGPAPVEVRHESKFAVTLCTW
jgi:hypothetical protein